MRMTYRILPGPGAGAFPLLRRKYPPVLARASTRFDSARLKLWEWEGGSVAKDSAVR